MLAADRPMCHRHAACGLRCADTERSDWVRHYKTPRKQDKSIDVAPMEPICIPKSSSGDDVVIVKLRVLHELWGQYSCSVSVETHGDEAPKNEMIASLAVAL